MIQKMKVYEYPLKDENEEYYVFYTIKEEVEPLRFDKEKLIQSFEYELLSE